MTKTAKAKKNHTRLLQTDCHIGIVGSGLGGLSAALAILQCDVSSGGKRQKRKSKNHKSRHECTEEINSGQSEHSVFQGRITIYERDLHATDRKEGYGMTLTYNPNGPLAQLDILESIARKDCPSRSHYLFNEKGEVMGYYGNAFHSVASEEDKTEQTALRGAGQRGNLRIPRAELRSILMDKIREVNEQNGSSKVCIEWGKRLVSYVDRPAVEHMNQIYGEETDEQHENKETSGEMTRQRPVLLQFEDGTMDEVDLLIGADGVNSVVARQYLSTAVPTKLKQQVARTDASPEYLGIFIIIGISDHLHPLIDERGYYTLDGNHRLFIMPFQGSRLENKSRRTMWQLSYPVVDREEANRLSKLDPGKLQQEVLTRCGSWHEPFPAMVKQTPLSTIWGTGLLERDPQIFVQHRQSLEIHGRIPSHVVLLGDAAHAMSPFKGSGANQALADGPLLAKWLSQSKFDSAVRGFMTEMARRSGVKVRASREAALKLHSKNCWEWMASQDGVDNAIFHGVEPEHVEKLLNALKERSIGASLGEALDDSIRSVIKELRIGDVSINKGSVKYGISVEELGTLQLQALGYALNGQLEKLREISRKSHLIIPKAIDSNGRTCVHLAALKGHVDTCRWLLSEAKVDPTKRDHNNKTALDAAQENCDEELVQTVKCWIKRGLSPEEDTLKESTEQDLYRHTEQQLRSIRTIQQLRSVVQNNRQNSTNPRAINHVLGCSIDNNDIDEHKRREKALAQEHGAVILRNYIPREVDQLTLGALALRPLDLNLKSVSTEVASLNPNLTKKRFRKQMEDIKSKLSISAQSPVVVQTNFGPQLLSQTASNAPKKQKIESFPFSKLRYLNLGEWNYNWGDRRYDKVPQAKPFPKSFSSFAERTYKAAQQLVTQSNQSATVSTNHSFDMAICNFYHLHRPSDRLGGHKDDVESDLTSPLITISLGAPGIFLLGGESRSCVPTAILLRAGDCMVMSGRSRHYFHGVPTILEFEDAGDALNETSFLKDNDVFPELDENLLNESSTSSHSPGKEGTPSHYELAFVKAFLTTARINISIRKV